MALTDLWLKSREQLESKRIQQIIAFAGDGQLDNGNATSREFRDFLKHVPRSALARYAEQCLRKPFPRSAFVLQDIVNEVGRRLGFQPAPGSYHSPGTGADFGGVWRLPGSHALLVEVWPTDTASVELDALAACRHALVDKGVVSEEHSSILLAVGSEDTLNLEARIRGSQHAWSLRLVGISALLDLLTIQEAVDDPHVARRLAGALTPREFTRVDRIVELVSLAVDSALETPAESDEPEEEGDATPRAAFHEACVKRIGKHLGQSLVAHSRTSYASPDGSVRVTCAVSKAYEKGSRVGFWFAFHPYQREFLEEAGQGFVAFGCGSPATVLLVPVAQFVQLLGGLNTTNRDGRFYWHVQMAKEDGHLWLLPKKGVAPVDVTDFLVE